MEFIIDGNELEKYVRIKRQYKTLETKEPDIRKRRINSGGDQVFWVSRYSLPSRAGSRTMGVKYNNSKTVEIDYNLPFGDDVHTYYHEEAHSLGTRNENAANRYANAA
jgi:hypothetical protein